MYETTPVAEIIEQEIAAGVIFGPFHQYWLRQRAPEKVRRLLELGRQRPDVVGVNQGFQSINGGLGSVATAAFGARNTSLAELNMLQDGTTGASANTSQAVINQYCAIPANDAYAGKVYEIKMGGVYGNTGTPTMIFTPRWGSSTTPGTNVTLGANSAWTSITGTSGLPYFIQFAVVIRTAPPGATQGTAYGDGTVSLGIPVTNAQMAATLMIGGTAATIDTTGQGAAGCGLTMNLTWSASSGSNTSTCNWWTLSSFN